MDHFIYPELQHIALRLIEDVPEAIASAIGGYLGGCIWAFLLGYIIPSFYFLSTHSFMILLTAIIWGENDIRLQIHSLTFDGPTETEILILLSRAAPVASYICTVLFMHNFGSGMRFLISGLHRLNISLLATLLYLLVVIATMMYSGVFASILRIFSVAYAKFRKLDAQFVPIRNTAISLAFKGVMIFIGLTLASGTFLWLVFTDDLQRLRLNKFRQRFTYHDIPVSGISGVSRTIRLLRSKPRSFLATTFGPIEPVEFDIFCVSIDDLPPYEAISYTWGSAERSHEIAINNKLLRITASAYAVLQQRGSYRTPRTIWIDSICINQDDELEKSHQVALMKHIYERSSRVIVWLGDSEDSGLAVGQLLLLRGIMKFQNPNDLHNVFLRQHHLESGEKSGKTWQALGKLLTHPWFFRVWIVQEIILPPVIHVVYGGIYLEWETFSTVMAFLDGNELSGLLAPGYFGSNDGQYRAVKPKNTLAAVAQVDSCRRKYHAGESLSLNHILPGFATRGATDDRDRIFAFLGIVPAIDSPLRPNYEKTVAEIYFETADYLISRPDNLWLLPLAGIGFPRKVENLPSWVPDWSSDRESPTLTYHPSSGIEADSFPGYRYKTSGTSKMAIKHIPKSLSISLAGEKFDAIKYIGPNHPAQTADMAPIMQCILDRQTWLHEIWKLADSSLADPYRVGELEQPLKEAFWRTLIGDRIYESRPVPKEYEEYYRLATRPIPKSATPNQLQIVQSILQQFMGLNTSEEEVFAGAGDEEDMIRFLEAAGLDPNQDFDEMCEIHKKTSKFWYAMSNCALWRRFCVTENGRMGFVPPLAEVGDMICVIYGMQAPLVLRRTFGDSLGEARHKLLGECYIHGAMDGEVMMGGEKDDAWLTIV